MYIVRNCEKTVPSVVFIADFKHFNENKINVFSLKYLK
jgi:hypothetical protein